MSKRSEIMNAYFHRGCYFKTLVVKNSFKNSLIIHKPIDLSNDMVDKTSHAVVDILLISMRCLMFFSYANFQRHRSIIVMNSLDTCFSSF